MIVLEFEVADLATTRFAISPLYEVVESLRLLRAPERAAAHIPWMRRALPVARTLPLATAFALTPRRPPVPVYYMPDFLVPPPVSPVATFSEELERLRATPEEQMRADVMRMLGSSEPPAVLAELLEDAPRALGQLADALGAYWAEVIEPEWQRIRALLDADLAYRAQRLTTGGHASLFGDLNRLVRFSESRLELELITDATVGLRGQGLLLVPSVFQWERPAVIYDAPWQPTLLYPARGVALLWEAEGPQPGAALAGVLGRTRTQVHEALDARGRRSGWRNGSDTRERCLVPPLARCYGRDSSRRRVTAVACSTPGRNWASSSPSSSGSGSSHPGPKRTFHPEVNRCHGQSVPGTLRRTRRAAGG